jgi:hypothetical protein
MHFWGTAVRALHEELILNEFNFLFGRAHKILTILKALS